IKGYFSPRIFNRITSDVAIITVVAVGEVLVLLTRNYDLSVGSIVGVTAYVVGTLLSHDQTMAPMMVVSLAIGLGALMGLINGALVSYGKVPSIIVTFGTLAIYRSVLVEISNAKTVVTEQLPQWLLDLPGANLMTISGFDIRPMVLMALIIVVLFQLIITYLPWGRQLHAIGSNPEAARIGGLPAQRIVLLAYVVCGALAGLAGFMYLVRFGNITVVAAQGMEMQVVAAAVVGGVSTNGGTGTMIGALLGAFMINLLQQSLLRWLQISEFWIDALLGALILFAVLVDHVIMDRLRAFWSHSVLQIRTDDSQSVDANPGAKENSHVA
ncbi:MAG: ABC transporter permease, partial [Chloroflexi bacterium]|nr:ABC transporter permease [Chloroflexota bacterium]